MHITRAGLAPSLPHCLACNGLGMGQVAAQWTMQAYLVVR